MTALLLISGATVAVIVVLALVLPCPACKLRRERMRAAYQRLRAKKSG